MITSITVLTNVSAQISFQLAEAIDMSDSPYELASGDYNNDGLPDVVSCHFNQFANKQVTVMLNTGTGTFSGTNIRTFASELNALDIATGDFDEDGNLDVVTCSQSGNNFSLLLGDGAGNLAAPANFNAGDVPQGIAVGDMNNDNHLDVLVSSRGTPADLRIFLGDGEGSFSAPVIIAFTNVWDVTVADFNGDTNFDFAVSAGNAIQIWLGDGSGSTFTLDHTTTSVGSNTDVDAVDLDSDGVMDIVTDRAYVMNDGSGSFAAPVLLDQPGDELVAGDFNNDGHPDLAQTDYNVHYPNIRIYLGNGSGVFTLLAKYEVAVYPNGMQVLDINNDMNADIVGVGTDGSLRKAVILLGDGNGYFNTIHKYPVTPNPRDIVKGDFNEDGIIDVAICHHNASNNVSVFLGQGQGKFIKTTTTYNAGVSPYQILTIDYNNDAHLDLVTFNPTMLTTSSITVLTGDGTGQFTALPDIVMNTAYTNMTGFGRITAADFNNDTFTDLAISGIVSRSIYLFTGTGTGFNAAVSIDLSEDVYEIKAGDFDGDNNQDIAAIYDDINKFLVLTGDGAGGFTEGTQYNAIRDYIDVRDINDDGNADVIVYSGSTNGLDIFINNGDGNFTGTEMTQPAAQLGLGYADIDMDGVEDIITGGQFSNSSSSGLIRVYKGMANGTFGAVHMFSKNYSGGNTLLTHDVNDDGREDIISVSFNMYEDYLAVLINTSVTACIPPAINNLSSDATVCGNGTHTLSVAASGSSPFSYQWKKNGTDISGATTASYNLSAVTSADAGAYTVQITNSCGSVTSNATNLSVTTIAAPAVTDGIRCGPGVVTLSASGSSDGNYRWYEVADGGAAISGEVSNAFTTSALSATTTYFVSILDDCESARTPVKAVINETPSVIDITSDFSVCSGVSVNLEVSATGEALNYQWSKNGSDITNATNASLTFSSISTGDAGMYSVEISNTCGSVISESVDVTVNASPQTPSATDASSCEPATLTLNASGGMNGDYRWYELPSGGTPIPGEHNDSFTTPLLTTSALYYVALTNGTCESSRAQVSAEINIPPSQPQIDSSIPPQNGVVTLCGNAAVTLTAPSGYSVYAWSDGSSTETITVSMPGVYSVEVTDPNGCTSVASEILTVTVDPVICNVAPQFTAETTVVPVEGSVSIDLAALISDQDNNLDLSTLKIISNPQSGAPAIIDANSMLIINYSGISFVGTDLLTLEVCDILGSCTQQQITIEVVGEIMVFSGISPNGDGLNDVFTIRYIDLLEETRNNSVSIFNRWGDRVFHIENYDNVTRVFKGLGNNNKELSSGTYFYKIQFASGRKPMTGYITLRK